MDVNNIYGSAVSKVACNWLKMGWGYFWIYENFIKSYNDESDEGYFLEVDVQCPENLHNLHNDLPFLPRRMKTEKFKELIAHLHDMLYT